MSKWFRRILISIICLVGLIIATAIFVAYKYEEEIKILAIDKLNETLETEVIVEKITFSLLRKFPKASIEFQNIRILESADESSRNLISAKSIFLEFNPFDLITGNYVIDVIQVDRGEMLIKLFEDGSNNYEFLSVDAGNKDFRLQLKKVHFTKSNLQYTDFRKAIEGEMYLDDLMLQGDLQADHFNLVISCTGTLNSLHLNSFELSDKKRVKLEMSLEVDKNDRRYSFHTANILFNKLNMALSGFMKLDESGTEYNLEFQSREARFDDLREFMNQKTIKVLDDYQSAGVLDINGTIKGLSSFSASPAINVSFDLHSGSLKHHKYPLRATEIALHGSYTNGHNQNSKTSRVAVDTFSFKGNFGVNTGSFSIENFDNPLLQFQLDFNIDLRLLKDLIGKDSLEIMEGHALLNVVGKSHFNKLTEFTARELKSTEIHGNLRIDSGRFKRMGMNLPIEDIDTKLTFDGNQIKVDGLFFVYGGVPFHLSGKLQNLIPFIAYKDESMRVSADLHCRELLVDQLIGDENKGANLAFPVSDQIHMELNFTSDRIKYRRFEATELSCQIKSNYPHLILQNLSFNAVKGNIEGWLQLEFSADRNSTIATDLSLHGVDISQLFYQCEDFGQKTISSEHLRGMADINLEFRSKIDHEFRLQAASTYTHGTLEIRNGELIGFEPARALSKYIDLEELEHIEFSRLSNTIEIKDEVVFIPEMEVKSSALEFVMSGRHSFKNEIEYHFQLWLNDFLFRKAKRNKRNKTEFGDIQMDESGRAKLFIRMTGTVDDYKINLDRRAVREQWNESLDEERSELKQILKEEFGKGKKERKEAPGNFEIEWEDERATGGNSTIPKKEEATEVQQRLKEAEKKKKKKGLFGKEIEDEYEEYDPNKLD